MVSAISVMLENEKMGNEDCFKVIIILIVEMMKTEII